MCVSTCKITCPSLGGVVYAYRDLLTLGDSQPCFLLWTHRHFAKCGMDVGVILSGQVDEWLIPLEWSQCIGIQLLFYKFRLTVSLMLRRSRILKTLWRRCGQHLQYWWGRQVLHFRQCCRPSHSQDQFYAIATWAYSVQDIDFKICMHSCGRLVFLRWHNVEEVALPPQQRGEFYISCPAWWTLFEWSLFLSVASHPIFINYLAVISDDKVRISGLRHLTIT